MHACYDVLVKLSPPSRRRAVTWLVDALGMTGSSREPAPAGEAEPDMTDAELMAIYQQAKARVGSGG